MGGLICEGEAADLPSLLTSCLSDRILLRDVRIAPVQVRPTGLRVGVEGLPRMQSNKYQSLLEKDVVRAIGSGTLKRDPVAS